jgi:hypothetical protein
MTLDEPMYWDDEDEAYEFWLDAWEAEHDGTESEIPNRKELQGDRQGQ